MRRVVCVTEDRPSGAALAGGTAAGTEVGQAARQLEPSVAGREVCSGLLEQRDRPLARRDERAHPGGVAERPSRA